MFIEKKVYFQKNNRIKKSSLKRIFAVFMVFVLFFTVFLKVSKNLIVKAEEMTSTNYKIISDDINSGGRDDQTSTSYKMQETIGGIATGVLESDFYKIMAGYRVPEEWSLTFSISDLSIGFGTFSSTAKRYTTGNEQGSTSEPANGEATVLSILTNAPNGATISIRSKGNGSGIEGNGSAGLYKSSSPTNLIAAAPSSSVTSGSEGYGVYLKNVTNNTGTLSIDEGFDNDNSSDLAISTTNQTLASASAEVDATVDLLGVAAISSTTPAGSYSDVLTLTGIGKF